MPDEQRPVLSAPEEEHLRVLFERVLSGRPVWVDSDVGQQIFLRTISWEDDCGWVVYDSDGNDRAPGDYLLVNPHRSESG